MTNKKKPLLEHQEQKLVVSYFGKKYPKYYGCFWSTPNGAVYGGNKLQRFKQSAKLKAEGMLPGVADLCFMVPRGEYHGLFIEMKRSNGTEKSLSEPQVEFIDNMNEQGYFAVWCAGHKEAIEVIDEYMGLRD